MTKEYIEKEAERQLRMVYDPEIPVNIYDLGMIYEIEANKDLDLYVKMTLTSPACPVAESLPGEVKARLKTIRNVRDVYIDLVWEPAWNQDMMSEEAKLILGFF